MTLFRNLRQTNQSPWLPLRLALTAEASALPTAEATALPTAEASALPRQGVSTLGSQTPSPQPADTTAPGNTVHMQKPTSIPTADLPTHTSTHPSTPAPTPSPHQPPPKASPSTYRAICFALRRHLSPLFWARLWPFAPVLHCKPHTSGTRNPVCLGQNVMQAKTMQGS